MLESRPLLSIVTVLYNSKKDFEETFANVLQQTMQDFELVIIDGGSDDGTVQSIQARKDRVAYWCSEPDRGIYHAMNKGIAHANGKWITFMNAGDSYYDNQVLADIAEVLNKHKRGVVYGNAWSHNADRRLGFRIKPDSIEFFSLKYNMPVCHQAMFFHHSEFENLGHFDESFKVVADHEWFVRFMSHSSKYAHYTNRDVVNYLIEGFSVSNRMRGFKERIRIAKLYYDGKTYAVSLLR